MESMGGTPHRQMLNSQDRPRVAAILEDPDMTHDTNDLSPRPRTLGTYAAAAVFLAVYLGGLAFVLAPKDLFAVQSGAVFAED